MKKNQKKNCDRKNIVSTFEEKMKKDLKAGMNSKRNKILLVILLLVLLFVIGWANKLVRQKAVRETMTQKNTDITIQAHRRLRQHKNLHRFSRHGIRKTMCTVTFRDQNHGDKKSHGQAIGAQHLWMVGLLAVLAVDFAALPISIHRLRHIVVRRCRHTNMLRNTPDMQVAVQLTGDT